MYFPKQLELMVSGQVMGTYSDSSYLGPHLGPGRRNVETCIQKLPWGAEGTPWQRRPVRLPESHWCRRRDRPGQERAHRARFLPDAVILSTEMVSRVDGNNPPELRNLIKRH